MNRTACKGLSPMKVCKIVHISTPAHSKPAPGRLDCFKPTPTPNAVVLRYIAAQTNRMILRAGVCVTNEAMVHSFPIAKPSLLLILAWRSSQSRARKRSSEPFVLCRVRNRLSVPFCKRALSALYALANSIRSAPPSVSRALKRTPNVFVFSVLHRDPVQTKEVATLGDDLPSKRNRRILLAARP